MPTDNTPAEHTQRIIGAFETVSFPEFDAKNIVAKIDTGAYTGAFHCSRIEERAVDDGKILVFSPFDSDKVVEKDNFVVKYVRSSNGTREKRYFITTEMVLGSESYMVTLSLANRSEMKWPVLIGRRFLRQNRFLVDPAQLNRYPEQRQS